MKKLLQFGLSISILLLGACGEATNNVKKAQAEQEQNRPKDMDHKDLPQVTAFQDEKTREFMVSIKEEEPGYYLLEGKTKKFRMLFPENARYVVRRSSYVSENEEILGFHSYDQETNISFDMRVKYYNGKSFVSDLDSMLEIVSGKNGYQGEYQQSEGSDTEIYIASQKTVYGDLDIKFNFDYSYFGFIRPIKNQNEGLDFSASFSCKDEGKGCSIEENDLKEKVNKIIESLKFIGKEKE
jgi:hypothetical protein